MPASRRSGKLVIRNASVTRVLTVAETLALNTTAIELVPAPGPGLAISFHEAVLSKPAGTVGAGGGATFIQYGTTGITDATRAEVFTAAASYNRLIDDNDRRALQPNTALRIHMATDDMTGNDQELTVTVVYSIYEV